MAKDKTKTWIADGKSQFQNLKRPDATLETPEQQEKDAQMIVKQILSGWFEDYHQAERAITEVYIPDPTISRAGISLALKRLKWHYDKPKSEE